MARLRRRFQFKTSQQFHHALQFGVRIVEVRGEAEVVLPLAVVAQRGDDAGVREFFVQRREVFARLKNGRDAAGVFQLRFGIQHAKTFPLQHGHKPRAFAGEFDGDVVHAELQRQFHRGDEADEADEIVRAGLEFRRAAAELDLVLRDEAGAADIVPAVDGRIQFCLQFAADV